jgi:hypothetical protein
MRQCFDRLAKNLWAGTLAQKGDAQTGLETSPDAQVIDLWFEPRREPQEDLGLLGQMTREPCILESYSGTVTLDEARQCVRKQLGRYQELQNKDATLWKAPPRLWIVSTGVPVAALGLGFEPYRGWPRGFYALAEAWRAQLVVRSELPRERATLLLRVTGTRRVLDEAVEDLKQEPWDSKMRQIAVRELARMHIELREEPGERTAEEEEFAMTGEEMLREVEARAREQGEKQGREQGEKEGREEGREEGARRMVRLTFERRFGPMPSSVEEAVGKAGGLEELERIMEVCLTRSRDELEQVLGIRVH